MNISDVSRKNIEYISKNFGCISFDFNDSEFKKSNDIFKNLYFEIYNANNYVDKKMNSSCLKKKIINIDVISQLPTSFTQDTHFFPSNIKNYIKNNAQYWLKYSCKFSGRTISINFILFNEAGNVFKAYDQHAKKIFMWIYLLNLYSSTKCSKKIDIYLYMTPFEKRMPHNQSVIIGPEHINTAFTTSCMPKTEIIIYRKEEWFKVLLHETFHSFGLDFSHLNNQEINKQIKTLFPIRSRWVRVFEAYCETWARILNCTFICFDVKYKNNIDKFVTNVQSCINIEANFSLYQMTKILNFMGLRYKDLIGDSDYNKEARQLLYKENTSVLSYYIITALLLQNYPAFLSWCKNNNTALLRFSNKPSNMNTFFELIKSNYNTQDFISNVNCMEKKLKKNGKTDNLKESTRMTTFE